MSFDKSPQAPRSDERWVRGDHFGLEIPADAEHLLSAGADFLTQAFQAAGSLAADNRVSSIVEAEEFHGGGTGRKLLLTVSYDQPQADLPERLFIKFSRNFDNELWDRGRFMMVSEVNLAVLSRTPEFPVAVPACLFADVESSSATGLIITERINHGQGSVEALYAKCMDYMVPEPLEHYRAIVKGLAKLSGSHRAGKLPAVFDSTFPYRGDQAAAMFSIPVPEEKLVERANRMFDFIARYPKLFPRKLQGAELRQQFIRDIPDVVAAQGGIRDLLFGNPDMVAFSHWNANIDNCWFWRDERDGLHCGYLDWANAGQMSVAQSVSGVISGAEPYIWENHLDDLLGMFVEEFAAHGGPRLSPDELKLHCLLIMVVSGLAYSMGAPVALGREIEDIDALESYRDAAFQQHENARIQLHMMTRTLCAWQTFKLGDLVRQL